MVMVIECPRCGTEYTPDDRAIHQGTWRVCPACRASEPENPFIWKDQELVTLRDIGSALVTISDREEAAAFMQAYRERTPHADVNVAYIAGYYDHDTMERIHTLTRTAHAVAFTVERKAA